MRLAHALVFLSLLELGACGYGQPIEDAAASSPGLPTADTFRQLSIGFCPWAGADASATVIAPGWLVTNEHAAITLPGRHYFTNDFDLTFAEIDGGRPLPFGVAHDGDRVWIYGVACGGSRRFAIGKVVRADAKHCFGAPRGKPVDAVDRFCAEHGYGTAPGFIVSADIGDGFSGGPVVNEKGELVGVVQGVITSPVGDLPDGTLGFAYHIKDVLFAGWPMIVAAEEHTIAATDSAAAPH